MPATRQNNIFKNNLITQHLFPTKSDEACDAGERIYSQRLILMKI